MEAEQFDSEDVRTRLLQAIDMVGSTVSANSEMCVHLTLANMQEPDEHLARSFVYGVILLLAEVGQQIQKGHLVDISDLLSATGTHDHHHH